MAIGGDIHIHIPCTLYKMLGMLWYVVVASADDCEMCWRPKWNQNVWMKQWKEAHTGVLWWRGYASTASAATHKQTIIVLPIWQLNWMCCFANRQTTYHPTECRITNGLAVVVQTMFVCFFFFFALIELITIRRRMMMMVMMMHLFAFSDEWRTEFVLSYGWTRCRCVQLAADDPCACCTKTAVRDRTFCLFISNTSHTIRI